MKYFYEKSPEPREATELREALEAKGVTDVSAQNEFMAAIDNAVIRVATEKGLLEISEE